MNGYVYVLLSVAVSLHEAQALGVPDFESQWIPIVAQDPDESLKVVSHGLGEMPILVDVQVKSTEAPNNDYIFPAIGVFTRDDDNSMDYGGVVYLYNEHEVRIAAPCADENFAVGHAIYTSSSGFFEGPNSQTSNNALIRVRAWRANSLPTPDFQRTGIIVRTRTSVLNDTYIELQHGLLDYPDLVLVRFKLDGSSLVGYMSDAAGSSLIAYPSGRTFKSSSGFFGFDRDMIRVWISSTSNGFLFEGNDGYALWAAAFQGELEVYAWGTGSLPSSYDILDDPTNNMQMAFRYDLTYDSLIRVWAESGSGPNAGYRFLGSGAAVYHTTVLDSVCTYGGLTYAYDANTLRLWRPTDVTNGGTVCVSNSYGQGSHAEANNDVQVFVQVWILQLNFSSGWLDVDNTCLKVN